MKTCPTCNSEKNKQTTSILTRILLSTYIFLTFLFFIGGIYYEALFALIPLVFPYVNICLDCNNTFLRILPKWNQVSVLKVNTSLDKYLLAISPSILIIALLIAYFPYTGLGRIIYLPFIFLLNSTIIVISLIIRSYLKHTAFVFLAILLTLIFTIIFYPQESDPHVLIQIWNAIFD